MLDCTVLVAEWGKTPAPVLSEGIRLLRSARADILGVALNKVDISTLNYGDIVANYSYGSHHPCPERARPAAARSAGRLRRTPSGRCLGRLRVLASPGRSDAMRSSGHNQMKPQDAEHPGVRFSWLSLDAGRCLGGAPPVSGDASETLSTRLVRRSGRPQRSGPLGRDLTSRERLLDPETVSPGWTSVSWETIALVGSLSPCEGS